MIRYLLSAITASFIFGSFIIPPHSASAHSPKAWSFGLDGSAWYTKQKRFRRTTQHRTQGIESLTYSGKYVYLRDAHGETLKLPRHFFESDPTAMKQLSKYIAEYGIEVAELKTNPFRRTRRDVKVEPRQTQVSQAVRAIRGVDPNSRAYQEGLARIVAALREGSGYVVDDSRAFLNQNRQPVSSRRAVTPPPARRGAAAKQQRAVVSPVSHTYVGGRRAPRVASVTNSRLVPAIPVSRIPAKRSKRQPAALAAKRQEPVDPFDAAVENADLSQTQAQREQRRIQGSLAETDSEAEQTVIAR